MNNRLIKTDNSYLKSKVNLRINHLPQKNNIKVLDCYAGECKIWNNIKTKTEENIIITGIDKKPYGNNLRGDNLKYLKGLNLDSYDIIDLDAYGVPFRQLEIIFKKGYKGILYITFIQSMFGQLPIKMLNKIGYTKSMIKKCPTLFNRGGIEKFKQYLAINGIKKITIVIKGNKNYMYISLKAL